jgi:short-subunit dehydrogenase
LLSSDAAWEEAAMTESSERPRALITGASSGIGRAFAERLAADGYDLILVARRRERLEELAAQIARPGADIEIAVADLSDRDAIVELSIRLAGDPSMELLVNNAGFGAYAPFLELDPDLAEEQIAVHIMATVRLTRAVLPGLVARGKGAVINVASTFAFTSGINIPSRPRATYVASKAYIVAFTELLAFELEGTGVKVQALCPGVVKTEFHDHIGGRPPGVPVLEPAEVVDASLAGLALGEVICVPQLRDTGAIGRIDAARRGLWEEIREPTVADRYKVRR